MKKGLLITLLSAYLIGGVNAQAQEKSYSGLAEFTGVEIAVPANVFVTQNPHQSVKIETNQSNLEKIEVEVKDHSLLIKSKKRNTKFTGKIRIYISMQKINELSLAGSGNITTQGKVTTDNIALSIAGSGNISSKDLSADNVKLSVAGSGNINIAGAELANSLKASVAGSGNIRASNFAVRTIKSSISGSANCYLNATEELNVSLAGSGNVYYSGRPLINANISGSGKVKSVD